MFKHVKRIIEVIILLKSLQILQYGRFHHKGMNRQEWEARFSGVDSPREEIFRGRGLVQLASPLKDELREMFEERDPSPRTWDTTFVPVDEIPDPKSFQLSHPGTTRGFWPVEQKLATKMDEEAKERKERERRIAEEQLFARREIRSLRFD